MRLLVCIPAVLVFGLGNALPTVCIPLIVVWIFGNREYGSIIGIMTGLASLGMIMGPLAGSIVFDNTGSYIPAWIAVVIISVVMAVLTGVGHKMKKKTDEKYLAPGAEEPDPGVA